MHAGAQIVYASLFYGFLFPTAIWLSGSLVSVLPFEIVYSGDKNRRELIPQTSLSSSPLRKPHLTSPRPNSMYVLSAIKNGWIFKLNIALLVAENPKGTQERRNASSIRESQLVVSG